MNYNVVIGFACTEVPYNAIISGFIFFCQAKKKYYNVLVKLLFNFKWYHKLIKYRYTISMSNTENFIDLLAIISNSKQITKNALTTSLLVASVAGRE